MLMLSGHNTVIRFSPVGCDGMKVNLSCVFSEAPRSEDGEEVESSGHS